MKVSSTGFAPLQRPRVFAVVLCLATVALYAIAGGARLARYGDLSAFIGFGCYDAESLCFAKDNAAVVPSGALVFRTGGYDGQFYYYIAADLYRKAFAASPASYEAQLDASAFRRARIGYPLLTFPAGFGGGRALIVAMIVLPALLHLALVLWLLRRAREAPGDRQWDELARDDGAFAARWTRPALIAFALNPISLFCYLYALADGLALNLMLVAFLCIMGAHRSRAKRRHASLYDHQNAAPPQPAHSVRMYSVPEMMRLAFGACALALALLTKEHALAGAVGLLCAACFALIMAGLRSRVSGEERGANIARSGAFVDAVGFALPALFAVAALFGWWRWIGFHPDQAAARGAFPMSGLWEYLSANPDAFFSGRTYLIGLLCAYLGILIVALRAMASALYRRIPGPGADTAGLLWAALGAGTLAANLALVSFAAADEYWGNFANILRLFTPGYGALLCVAFWKAFVESDSRTRQLNAGDSYASTAIGDRVLRFALWFAVVATAASVFAIVEGEIAGRLLPVFEFGSSGF